MIFLDASALVKTYVDEDGTPTMQALMRRMEGRLVVTHFIALEVLSTFTKILRNNKMRRGEYRRVRGEFLADFATAFELFEVAASDVRDAMGLADEHRQIGVGALDLLHVTSALRAAALLRSSTVVVASSDVGFLRLADACGLRTFDPETEPLGALLSAWR